MRKSESREGGGDRRPGSGLPAPFDLHTQERRNFLTLLARTAALVAAGHSPLLVAQTDRRRNAVGMKLADLSPDRNWPIYRRYHLMIVGQGDDPRGMALARAVAETLARILPTSRAESTRAKDSRRVGVLIATDQHDVAVMTNESAEALLLGKPPFVDLGASPLRAIVSLGSHLLVCRPDFLARHAYLVAKTLSERENALPVPASASEGPVPAHPGARAFFAGEAIPND
ncbi:MAG: hypothetical protein ABI423_04275 [Burkholderiales bacterium]